jgi:hypothetical protein
VKDDLSATPTWIEASKYNWTKKTQEEEEEEEEEEDKNSVCYRFYSTFTARTLPRKLLNGSETSNVRKCTSHCEMGR